MSNRFQPGNPGGPGRPKGSRNRLGEAFLDAVCVDFQAHGAAAIEAARVESPVAYVRMVAALLPQRIETVKSEAQMSDEELLAIISRGGGDAESSLSGD